ncbi:MAG: hypothetical protein JNL58_30090 [Planctomyces sp.]|nr:hypothetical protein [Planctomyces sp.]
MQVLQIFLSTLAVIGPIVLALCSTHFASKLYVVASDRFWSQWRPREVEAEAALMIPADVRKPSSFADVCLVDDAAKAAHKAATLIQKSFRGDAVVTSVLPLAAIFCLLIQVVFFPQGYLSIGLVGAELACLFLLVCRVWSGHGPTSEWVRQRTVSELLRREQYMALAALGPYFTRLENDRIEVAKVRLASIPSDGPSDVFSHLELSRADGLSEVFSQQGRVELEGYSLRERILSYIHYRIRKQGELWMPLSSKRCELEQHLLNSCVRFVVVLALVVAAVHLGQQIFHLAGPPAPIVPQNQEGLFHHLVILIGAFLPPLSAWLLSLQQLRNCVILGRLYQGTAGRLVKYLEPLKQLLQDLDASAQGELTILHRFQRLVMAAETELTHELVAWQCIVHRDHFELSA